MSDTYHLACIPCRKSIWIGQSQNSGHPFCFYSDEKDTMETLRVFLWEHLGHSLVMEDMQVLEMQGIIKSGGDRKAQEIEKDKKILELQLTISGLQDVIAGRVKPLEQIEKELEAESGTEPKPII